jgi:hypothetical protein
MLRLEMACLGLKMEGQRLSSRWPTAFFQLDAEKVGRSDQRGLKKTTGRQELILYDLI